LNSTQAAAENCHLKGRVLYVHDHQTFSTFRLVRVISISWYASTMRGHFAPEMAQWFNWEPDSHLGLSYPNSEEKRNKKEGKKERKKERKRVREWIKHKCKKKWEEKTRKRVWIETIY